MIGYHYFDTRNREILYVPRMFVVIDSKEGTEVILDPTRLERRFSLFKRDWGSIRRNLVDIVEIPQKIIDSILDLCYSNRTDEANNYILSIFDSVSEEEFGIDYGADEG